jgi:glycosidase
MDSDGDGVGDFRSLVRRLDYLQGLGVTAIWLMPFQDLVAWTGRLASRCGWIRTAAHF